MTGAKVDRRTERTRKALRSAFIELTLTRGYDAVTVEDIVARADIGRSTFYTHYTGKEEILRQTMSTPSSPLANIVGGRTSPETLLPILSHFREQRKINRIFFGSPIRPIWVGCLAEMIESRLAVLSRETRAHPILPQRLIALQVAEAQLALVANWLMGKAACSAEALAKGWS